MTKINYYMPVKIIYKVKALVDIKKHIDDKTVLLVTSAGHIKRGLLNKLKNVNITHVIDNIDTHPEFKNLESIYESILDIDFDIILAIGGGSVIDSAKYLSVYNNNKDKTFVTKLIKNQINTDYFIKPFISVPTTAGTGSEITPWATIWDMEEKKKYSLYLPELFSKIAIYDPSLTLSVPKDVTIQTGLDTLSHALESIWNKNANEITINYAIKSAKLIVDNLPLLLENLNNLEYRDNIMKACMYAGLAFSNTQTAVAHAMSYYMTAHKNIPHGIACSFTLPMLIDNIIGKYDFIDEALIKIFGECSSKPLREMLKVLNISTVFSDYGIYDEELELLKSSLDKIQRAENSLVAI
ncbi:phosphonoacetaldehyde reductase [Nitratifractor salsuginis]|uniref:Iron-containing alcohol dehydrogenase n=1 Tax=Nitratifractor salsuginis (strain DSM 16511 / JCM 12458 / E9I37-1) TaxID=749222 RepID=E6WZM2_NITSE|nr:phosphonoacetaldehyde reductase [Nitratifractor salsuginis]ADV46663.1 iron-containing alcohol dehydrogenase [Nitratifractor salsuginis DSM 16511]